MIEQPTPPMDGECCESECSPCVWDIYYEELARWREAQAKNAQAKQNTESNHDADASPDNASDA